ncbi:MAG: hypothetical protein U0992_15385 [Planctomycetaceae bacterium]
MRNRKRLLGTLRAGYVTGMRAGGVSDFAEQGDVLRRPAVVVVMFVAEAGRAGVAHAADEQVANLRRVGNAFD